MNGLRNKKILLGLTGSIAAYKSAELLRLLKNAGAEVRVVMTSGASEFITPLTMQSLSGHPVHQHLLDAESEAGMDHISLARWADFILIAPASANFMARLQQGEASDLLTTLCLATDAPIALAPAMNRLMWDNPATQQNRQQLEKRGIKLFGPASGEQACGETGEGRMLEPSQIIEASAAVFQTGILEDKSVLITAGPTREAIDPVRFISNHSSGKMGYAIAQAAIDAGAKVTLVSGPVNLATPEGVERINVISAMEMHQAVMDRIDGQDIFIATAAVADYRPQQIAENKIKKNSDQMQISLIKNPDILFDVGHLKNRPFVVGFAAETENLEQHATEKMVRKKADMIAGNLVGSEQGGFNSDNNALTLYWQDGKKALKLQNKNKLARELVALIKNQLS